MSEDRVTLNSDGDWNGPDYAVDMVDEVVVHDALVHFEMTHDAAGYLLVQSPRREVFLRFHARPTTRAEQRQILASADETLRDHLVALLPSWLGGRSLWSVPWYRRPASTLRSWWQARVAAGAVFYADCEDDRVCGGPEVPR